MSFYQNNTTDFYLGEGQPNWSFKHYAEQIGKVIVLNISEDPISMKAMPKNTTLEKKQLVASRLTHIETVTDPKEQSRVVYLLIFDSGLQVIINANKTEEDLLHNVQAYLDSPLTAKQDNTVTQENIVVAATEPEIATEVLVEAVTPNVTTVQEKPPVRRRTRSKASPVKEASEK